MDQSKNLSFGKELNPVYTEHVLFVSAGWRLMMEVFCVSPGTVQSCVDVIRDGHILGISPGGVREALFGDEYYQLMWGQRSGFAKVALQTKVVSGTDE